MKTTIEISDPLFARARRYAKREGLTMRAVVEMGLRRVIEDKPAGTGFKLRDASVSGEGLQPEFQGASWEQIRAAIYEGRGG
jgi:Arc/MetJ family transcription regulator